MGMVGCFVALPQSQLSKLIANPDLIEEFLYPDDGDSEPDNYVDVDKSWHGIHYLLTGEAHGGEPPLALVALGGEEFGPEVGYGPARFLTPGQVEQVASALRELSVEAAQRRFNPADMEAKQIYPDVIWVRDGTDALDYVLDNYRQLTQFYFDAASRGDAVIQWLC